MAIDPISELRRLRSLNGDSVALAVDRAINEIKHGRFVAITAGPRALVVTALETASAAVIERLRAAAVERAALLLTAERAGALDQRFSGPVSIPLRLLDAASLAQAAGLDGTAATRTLGVGIEPWQGDAAAANAAFMLAKLARVVPAMVGFESTVPVTDQSVMRVDLAAIERIARGPLPELKATSTSRVPLQDAEDCTITLFRDTVGGSEHLAVTIGHPDPASNVPVRMHSACLTGDVLGSLRCDCGEQLRSAVRRIADLGGGILLYLDQEGRGIGLANKLRAYTIQDEGLDTLDADRHLGFRPDERNHGVAAAILSAMGITRIDLLTNNPQKIEALRGLGIDVAGRLPLVATSNVHNERYLRAKRERAGHWSEDSDG